MRGFLTMEAVDLLTGASVPQTPRAKLIRSCVSRDVPNVRFLPNLMRLELEHPLAGCNAKTLVLNHFLSSCNGLRHHEALSHTRIQSTWLTPHLPPAVGAPALLRACSVMAAEHRTSCP